MFNKTLWTLFLFLTLLHSGHAIGTAFSSEIIPDTTVNQYDPPVYSSFPDWESLNPHYSTGGALADIDHDGWLDLIVADGNDIQQGRLNVYYNTQGGFPLTADWQSSDIAYNGHIDIADVNGDGWDDVAVAHLGTGSTFAPVARLYLNNDGTLSSLPDWTANINGNAFGVAFGDINNDARPDLAVATGWSYSPQHFYHNYVYYNDNGVLESTPSWTSSDMNHYMGALWLDADHDGWLDLAFIGSGQETQIYHNLGGSLETSAGWTTSDSSNQDGIMLATGDVTMDGYPELFATDNTQLGGSGKFKQYLGLSSGFFETTASWTYQEGYGSAVAIADVNADQYPDLATGAWWDYTRLFINAGTGLPTTPTWNSGGTSVVEKIVFGNVGPTASDRNKNVWLAPGYNLYHLPDRNIQYINSVTVDGDILDPDEFMYDREDGWLVVNTVPVSEVMVNYDYSWSLDMIVTNWDSSIGNYLYYNQLSFADLNTTGELEWKNVIPHQTIAGNFTVTNIGEPGSELSWRIESYPSWGEWTMQPSSGDGLKPEDGAMTISVQVIAPVSGGPVFTGEVVVINEDNPSDYGVIPVSLELQTDPTPVFNITSIKGDLGVHISFENVGDAPATDLAMVLHIQGGIFNLIDKNISEVLSALAPGETFTLSSGLFIGLGKISVYFSVISAEGAAVETQVDGKQLLLFSFIN